MQNNGKALPSTNSAGHGIIVIMLITLETLDEVWSNFAYLYILTLPRRWYANVFWYLSPRFFLKKSEGDIVFASVRPSVRLSIMQSPPKPLDEIQPNLVRELHEWGVQR